MKKTLQLLALLLCIASFAIGTISCESREQKEARAKAEAEKQRVLEQLKTKTGLLQYLAGKTFAYTSSTHTSWLKVTFIDKNTAIVYDVAPWNRGWGEGYRCRIELFEPKDVYGKNTGEIKIKLKDDTIRIWSFDWSYHSDFCLNTVVQNYSQNLYGRVSSITLSQVNTDYFPKEWKD